MTRAEMEIKVAELKEWEALLEEAKEQAESIKDELKAEMIERETEEIVTDKFVIRWQQVISNRFDTTNFKKQFGDLYKTFTKPVTSRRFTVTA